MSESRDQSHDPYAVVTAAELRLPELPFQYFGGYSRAETDQLLSRAAATLERLAKQASDEPPPVEQTVGEALVTAHRVAETVRAEAKEEADALIASARTEAQGIIQEAESRADELSVEHAQVETALSRARDEARVAEREIAELHDEARRVRSVIDEFRIQWSNLVNGALEQLELRISRADQAVDGDGGLERDLRDQLVAPQPEEPRQLNEHVQSSGLLPPQ